MKLRAIVAYAASLVAIVSGAAWLAANAGRSDETECDKIQEMRMCFARHIVAREDSTQWVLSFSKAIKQLSLKLDMTIEGGPSNLQSIYVAPIDQVPPNMFKGVTESDALAKTESQIPGTDKTALRYELAPDNFGSSWFYVSEQWHTKKPIRCRSIMQVPKSGSCVAFLEVSSDKILRVTFPPEAVPIWHRLEHFLMQAHRPG